MDVITDYITNRTLPRTHKEEVRQKVERFLVEEKGYPKDCVMVDYAFKVEVDGKIFFANIDLLVRVGEENIMNIECAPPTVLASLERKAIATSRIIHPIPVYTVVTDWEQTKVFDTVTGKLLWNDIKQIPDFEEAKKIRSPQISFDEERIRKEKRILFAYMGVLHCKCEYIECSKD